MGLCVGIVLLLTVQGTVYGIGTPDYVAALNPGFEHEILAYSCGTYLFISNHSSIIQLDKELNEITQWNIPNVSMMVHNEETLYAWNGSMVFSLNLTTGTMYSQGMEDVTSMLCVQGHLVVSNVSNTVVMDPMLQSVHTRNGSYSILLEHGQEILAVNQSGLSILSPELNLTHFEPFAGITDMVLTEEYIILANMSCIHILNTTFEEVMNITLEGNITLAAWHNL